MGRFLQIVFLTAVLTQGDGGRDRVDPDFAATLREIDAFHTPVVDSTQMWAEWHYFNYHDDAGRSFYISMNAIATEGDLTPSGYSHAVVLFEMVDPAERPMRVSNVVPGGDIAASYESPDLVAGPNTVRLDESGYHVHLALTDSLARPISVELELLPTPNLLVPPIIRMSSKGPFGYVVPVVRGRVTGRVTIGDTTFPLDGVGYHDHNWGHFRDAAWDWGVVHAGDISVLYGRFATSMNGLQTQPVSLAIFDAEGGRPYVQSRDYEVRWKPAGVSQSGRPPRVRITQVEHDSTASVLSLEPGTLLLSAVSGDDSLSIRIDVKRRFVAETGAGEQPLFRADPEGRSFFFQLEGGARVSGRVRGQRVDARGHAFAETFRVDATGQRR